MGSAHARQHVASRNNVGGSGMGGSQTTLTAGGPPPDASAASTTPTEGEKDERIPVVFTWTHGGQTVHLAASFNGWREQIPMVRSGNEFSVVHELPRGIHQYKFIVDDQWRFASDQPKTQDAHGNMNNMLDISNYQKFQAVMNEKEPVLKFGQVIPDPNDYTLDAPHIPLVLHKSPFCALPPRPEASAQPLSIQTHSLCDHIYLQERADPSVPLTVAVTHRYNQKYSTTVFATRGPFGFGPAGQGPNWLKSATRRPPKAAS
mmetsp:Transcript_60438/g.197813  ORF Transcript_60438/g.197813 Transcript_60438/m.197813 type:complete len:261 (+) Transcript_60438:140-922(+)